MSCLLSDMIFRAHVIAISYVFSLVLSCVCVSYHDGPPVSVSAQPGSRIYLKNIKITVYAMHVCIKMHGIITLYVNGALLDKVLWGSIKAMKQQISDDQKRSHKLIRTFYNWKAVEICAFTLLL